MNRRLIRNGKHFRHHLNFHRKNAWSPNQTSFPCFCCRKNKKRKNCSCYRNVSGCLHWNGCPNWFRKNVLRVNFRNYC